MTLSLISQFTKSPWLYYHKPSFSGQVIDIDTKQPIEGAVVEAFYYSRLMIAPGTGGGPTIFKIRETLTDKEGRFTITPYTTWVSPFDFGERVTFSVYKPGYAGSGASEEQFSKNGWKHIEEYTWFPNKTKTIKFHDGVFELPKLESKEDRDKAMPTRSDKSEQQKLLTKILNEERSYLGYSSTLR